MASDNITSIAAWYGATLSSLGFSLALYVALRDRARPRISVQKDMILVSGDVYEKDGPFLVVTVANRGRRPLTVALVGFTLRRKKGQLILPEALTKGPREIREGKSDSFMAYQEAIPLRDLDKVVVRDSTGRTWKKRIPRDIRRG